MSKNLYQAYRQWAARPPDERFISLESLHEYTGLRKLGSIEEVIPLRNMRIYATYGGALTLNGHLPSSYLTNWAFGQLCSQVRAPAGYLRTLPAETAARCLEYGITKSDLDSKILIRKDAELKKDQAINLTAAFTSPSYGRIWDFEVVENLMQAIEGSSWHLPLSDTDVPAGLYASDRDMFVFLISDDDPVEVGNARLGKGFFCWNSETGSATFGLTTFLYNYICGNHIIWGAEQVHELKIIHRNRALNRFYSDAIPALNRFVENRNLSDTIKDTVAHAMNYRIGSDKDGVFNWFKDKPFTKGELMKAWETGIPNGEDVTTLWGMIQGMTAYSRNIPHANKRVSLERRAGALLQMQPV